MGYFSFLQSPPEHQIVAEITQNAVLYETKVCSQQHTKFHMFNLKLKHFNNVFIVVMFQVYSKIKTGANLWLWFCRLQPPLFEKMKRKKSPGSCKSLHPHSAVQRRFLHAVFTLL